MTGDTPIMSFESPHSLSDLCIPEDEGAAARALDQRLFNVRMVNSQGLREAASLLVNRMYSWRGYQVEEGRAGAPPDRITLVTDIAGHTVGTMTLCFDAAEGLPADANFQPQLDRLRAEGRRLCEPSRLAIDTNVPRRVFAALIHISYIYAHNIHGYTDYVIEVNPRHAMFYKKMLGFTDFGAERLCTRVNAPAVLLRLELDYMKRQIAKLGGLMENHDGGRSYYPYFFPSSDEAGITSRLIAGRN